MKKIIFISFVAGLLAACDTFKADVNPESGTISQGGSLARFTIVGDYLYIVNDRQLIPVNIRDLAAPQKNAPVDLDIGVETIFPYQGNLFIGSASAVYIYSLGNPAAPARLSVYQHATGCDPVVVKDNYAYVTLREGVSCLNTFQMNVLEVLDISNLRAPNMVATVDMRSPRGLGIGCNQKLFVCEGNYGLTQFSIADPRIPEMEKVYSKHAANDIIVRDSLVIVTGNDGIYQYACSADTLQLLSILPLSL